MCSLNSMLALQPDREVSGLEMNLHPVKETACSWSPTSTGDPAYVPDVCEENHLVQPQDTRGKDPDH